MDTKNIINPHSKEKLKVYEEYLKQYLPVMINSPFIDNVRIIEPFAGKGIDNMGNKGSALLAKDIILSFAEKKNYKKIKLYLNDKKEEHYKSLCEKVNSSDFQVEIFNKDADLFITDILKNIKNNTHSFIFIDPYGYTQIKNSTYDLLFSFFGIDILIFIPTSFIYRFLKSDEKKNEYKPIANFLNDFGIDEKIARILNNINDFSEEIIKGIKNKSKAKFVYKKQIKCENGANIYHLFFVSKHIYGADKYLEAIWKIEKDNPDLFTFTGELDDLDKSFENEILRTERNNCELYELGIELGFRSSRQQEILRYLEDRRKIRIENMGYQKNKKFCYYTNYNNYKNNDIRIKIVPLKG